MGKQKFSEEQYANAINAALNKTTLDDDEIEKYFEGIMDVVSGKIQAKTAAQRHRLDLKQLNKFVGWVKLDDEEAEEEKSETNVGGNDENAMEEDKNLEKEDDEEEETKDEGKHKQKAVKRGATIKEKKGKQKTAKMESEKKGKSSNEVMDIDSPKPAKKKRRKHELEVLLAEANENVFKGQHPDNQSLELALAKNHHDEEENHHSTMPPFGTRSRRSLIYSTNAIPQQKPLPMGWKEKAANNVQSESTTSSSSQSGPSNSTSDPFNKPKFRWASRKPMAKMNNVKSEMNTSPGTGGTLSGSAMVKANGPNPIGTVTTTVKKTKHTVYVGNLPSNTTANDVGDHFSQCGEVIDVRLIYDRATNRFKGFGFCDFKDAQGAQEAVSKLNGVDFNGRALKVDHHKWSKA